MNQKPCLICNKLVLTETCEICDIELCEPCRISEGHMGTFECIKCKRILCKTYDHENGQCWFCVVSEGVKELNEYLPNLGTTALEILGKDLL